MQGIKKITVILLLLCSYNLYSYDYPWPVEYLIKNESLEDINRTIQTYILNNPKIQIHVLKQGTYKLNMRMEEPYHIDKEMMNALEENGINTKNMYVFPKGLDTSIYLNDVDAAVHFSIVQFETGKIVLRVSGYGKHKYEIVENQRRIKKGGEMFSFNDVEPTKKEIPIKESFEKNFMSKLPLEWEYVKPTAIDRRLSKLLSFFRKRKNFSDE